MTLILLLLFVNTREPAAAFVVPSNEKRINHNKKKEKVVDILYSQQPFSSQAGKRAARRHLPCTTREDFAIRDEDYRIE